MTKYRVEQYGWEYEHIIQQIRLSVTQVNHY